MNPNQSSPPTRVLATKGFYATIAGVYGVVNPDDIVELDRPLAAMMLSSGKAVQTDKPLRRQTDYLPERLRNPPVDAQALRLDALTKSVERLAELVATLAAGQPKPTKEK